VALFGGAYGVTSGLLQELGQDRVLDTPISEAAMVGLAVGVNQVVDAVMRLAEGGKH